MLQGIRQTDKRLLTVIQKYGCLFLCFAHASPMIFAGEEGIKALNLLWRKAEDEGVVSGDLNKDGDYDDEGEAEVRSHDGLAKLFALDVRYDGKHRNPKEKIPDKVAVVFGCYYWKGTHFVVLNHRGDIVFDPIGYSNTVKNGYLKSMRWYYAN